MVSQKLEQVRALSRARNRLSPVYLSTFAHLWMSYLSTWAHKQTRPYSSPEECLAENLTRLTGKKMRKRVPSLEEVHSLFWVEMGVFEQTLIISRRLVRFFGFLLKFLGFSSAFFNSYLFFTQLHHGVGESRIWHTRLAGVVWFSGKKVKKNFKKVENVLTFL